MNDRPVPLYYLETECPNCGRLRVEHWSNGKDVCEIKSKIKEIFGVEVKK